jgi:predicted MFS family arabinose efflux permease
MPASPGTLEGRATSLGRCRDLAGAALPPFAVAALEALRFEGRSPARLANLSPREWRDLLAFCDPAQLTLLLEYLAAGALPAAVRERIRQNALDYAPRFDRLKRSLLDVAAALDRRGIEFAVLKGVGHAPDFTPDPFLRLQGDIDIWCSPDRVLEARDAAAAIGFRVAGHSPGRHLPPMLREDRWKWSGNYFAADLPIALELHYRLWDDAAEFIAAPGEDGFWARRVTVDFEGTPLPVLAPPDALGFACLHLLMHILHDDLRLQRAWEIARFLDARAGDDSFWLRWASLHAGPLRRLEAVIFDLAAQWFGAALSPVAEEEIARLPADVRLWLERYSLSPIESLFHSRKDGIWLHLALLDSPRSRRAVFLRRTFPARAAVTAPRARFLASRLAFHLRTLCPTLLEAVRWRWRRTRLGRPFLRFQMAASVYGFGVVIFVVLYNLFLLSMGFHEAFLGRVAGVTTLGTVAGSLPAAALSRRFGLRRMLPAGMAGAAAASFARAWSGAATWQLGASFLNGLCFSVWAVAYSPAVAALSDESNRQLAFSISCATGMIVCALGGLAAGLLPAFLEGHLHVAAGPSSQRAALLLASGLIAAAAAAASRLRFEGPGVDTSVDAARMSACATRRRFLVPFLAIVSLWAAATGAFNPFFNSFFAVRLRLDPRRIGAIYFCSQAVQAAGLLAVAPLFRRWGNARGIAALQLLAGGALVSLAWAHGPIFAAAAYVGYCSFQYMTEPGVFSMLMGGVRPGERAGASAFYFTATSVAAALAAWAGGAAISRAGYPPVLLACAAAALLCAVLSWRYLR